MGSMEEITEKGDRLEQLKSLSIKLARAIDTCEDSKSMAQLARQYRETIKELESLKKEVKNDDEISSILSNRLANGKSNSVRKNST